MKIYSLIAILLSMHATLFAACESGKFPVDGDNGRTDENADSDTNSASGADTETDTDTDANTGTSTDTGTGTGTGTGTDTDTDSFIEPSMPVFLLAGQSNMEGNVDEALFSDLLSELDQGPKETLQTRLENPLSDWYHNWNDGYAMYGYSESVVSFEASELIRLNAAGLVNSTLVDPYSDILCSINDSEVAPLATNCGHPFGPELVLGHYLGTTSYSPTSLIKIANGGTTLYTDWLSPTSASDNGRTVGDFYTKLQSQIQALETDPASVHPECALQQCRWAAFIWFQGENDCFDNENAQSYEENLTNFVADVRHEIGSPTLPVIIVEIGAWGQSLAFGDIVTAAQQSVAAADPYADIVTTNDLSGFYHYDPAAQLIIGERIALVLNEMLQ